MSANFDSFAVFIPRSSHHGGYDLVKVLALDDADAITKASIEWHGKNCTEEGTYVVCKQDDLTAYEVEQERSPSVRNQVSLP